MTIVKDFRNLCKPAFFYASLSILGLLLSLYENRNSKSTYKLVGFATNVGDSTLLFVFQIAYILFWTWILNLMCKDNHSGFAWFLVLLPFILLFLILVLVIVHGKSVEGLEMKNDDKKDGKHDEDKKEHEKKKDHEEDKDEKDHDMK